MHVWKYWVAICKPYRYCLLFACLIIIFRNQSLKTDCFCLKLTLSCNIRTLVELPPRYETHTLSRELILVSLWRQIWWTCHRDYLFPWPRAIVSLKTLNYWICWPWYFDLTFIAAVICTIFFNCNKNNQQICAFTLLSYISNFKHFNPFSSQISSFTNYLLL